MSKDTEILVNLLKPLVDFQCLALDKKVVDKNLEINLDKIYKIFCGAMPTGWCLGVDRADHDGVGWKWI